MDIARLYVDAQRCFVDLCRTLDDDDWATQVLCTPAWTVRDVLSHVAGVADDIMTGNLDGAMTESWTASQVERWRDTPWQDLVSQWSEQAATVGERAEMIGEPRAAFDCHSHEHDVRHAIGRPGNRDSEIIGVMAHGLGRAEVGRPLRIEPLDGPSITSGDGRGDGEFVLRGVTMFELARSRIGRRSRAQVEAYDWSEPPGDDVLDHWFVFGPNECDVDE